MKSLRRVLRELVPRMFHRRLLLLAVLVLGVMAGLSVRLSWLTIARGAAHRAVAESVLTAYEPIPTVRGRILDRKGRVLAVDRPADAVAVRYDVLTGDWAYRRARLAAIRSDPQRWAELGYFQRQALIDQHEPPYRAQIQQMWQALAEAGGVGLTELLARRDAVLRRVMLIRADYLTRQRKALAMQRQEDVSLSEVEGRVQEEDWAHVMLTDAAPDAVVAIRRQIGRAQLLPRPRDSVWSRVRIDKGKRRDYPLETLSVEIDRTGMPDTDPGSDQSLRQPTALPVTVQGVAMQVVGILRDVQREDFEQQRQRLATAGVDDTEATLRRYTDGDRVGARGIEASMEPVLRGTRGRRTTYRDTQQTSVQPPEPGGDVRLSIDVMLQARIQAVMSPEAGLMRVAPWHGTTDRVGPEGTPLNGSAVVVDVATGQVIAAVSIPAMPLRALRDAPATIWDDHLNRPYLNRPVSQPMQPGSVVKPLVAAVGLTTGRIGPHETIHCSGYLDPERPDRYRCWIHRYNRGHGDLAARDAIAQSCNVYFYVLGERIGAEALVRWYQRWGMGRLPGSGLGEEVTGDLPDLALAGTPAAARSGFAVYDARFMAIGQGPARWTPLQAAAAYAALGRGGYYVAPTFLAEPDRLNMPQRRADIGIDPAALRVAMDGLWGCANDPDGTAHHLSRLNRQPIFNLPGVTVYAKSGTAQAVDQRIDSDGDGRITTEDQVVRRGDHGWVVGLVKAAGQDQARYAFAVAVEFGGSGGSSAGPIANQLLYALRAEGYL